MSDLFLLETAVQTLRGVIDDRAALAERWPTGVLYTHGHHSELWRIRGMRDSLELLEGMLYEQKQCEIETMMP